MLSLKVLTLLVVPSVLWGLYHYYKDIHKPEPWRWLLLSFALGVTAGWLAGQVYWLLAEIGLRQNQARRRPHKQANRWVHRNDQSGE